MSYILDALRKSEQERLRGQPLSSLSHAPIGQEIARRPGWLLPLLAANLVLGTVLAVWWLRSAADNDVEAQAASAAPIAGEPAAIQGAIRPKDGTRLSAPASASLPPVTDATGAIPSTTPEDEYVPLPESPLPNEAYERAGDWRDASSDGWPALALSTHVYSSAPASRNIIINGLRMKQGDSLENGVKIEEITETGARVSWRGAERELDITR